MPSGTFIGVSQKMARASFSACVTTNVLALGRYQTPLAGAGNVHSTHKPAGRHLTGMTLMYRMMTRMSRFSPGKVPVALVHHVTQSEGFHWMLLVQTYDKERFYAPMLPDVPLRPSLILHLPSHTWMTWGFPYRYTSAPQSRSQRSHRHPLPHHPSLPSSLYLSMSKIVLFYHFLLRLRLRLFGRLPPRPRRRLYQT